MNPDISPNLHIITNSNKLKHYLNQESKILESNAAKLIISLAVYNRKKS